jgi:glycosyltransferase involved in cell wall biosynthesis
MRILMIAPQPFFSPRGTPYSVWNRCRALCALGHEVDLVTYHLGDDVVVPGLRIIRAPRIPGIRRVKIGPSLPKLPLDTALLLRSMVQLRRRRYDAIHTHEEAGVFGWWLSRATGLPHLYDMHSDLAQQLTNFGFGERHPLTRSAAWLERRVLRSATSVVVICPDLADRARAYLPGLNPVLIENAPLESSAGPQEAAAVRARLAADGASLLVYTGTLEPYQGMPLLIEAFARLRRTHADIRARLVIAGGRPDQVIELQGMVRQMGVDGDVSFLGLLPPADIPALIAAADVLVSPRSSGTNTPLKLYSYMRSGKPIVATRRLTHTQVLDDSTAFLVDPSPDALADGLAKALANPQLASAVGRRARTLAEDRYSVREFLRHTVEALDRLEVGTHGRVPMDEAERNLEAA